MRRIEVPGDGEIRLEHLVLDLNGTLTNRGVAIDGVADRLSRLSRSLAIHILTADTFGTASMLSEALALPVEPIRTGAEKAAIVADLGSDSVIAIGNGRNDEAMLRAARIGIVVLGPEGAAAAALMSADIVCGSILDALDLVLDDRAIAATIRG